MANHTMSSNTFSATIFSVFSPVPVYSAIGVTLIGLDEQVILNKRKDLHRLLFPDRRSNHTGIVNLLAD